MPLASALGPLSLDYWSNLTGTRNKLWRRHGVGEREREENIKRRERGDSERERESERNREVEKRIEREGWEETDISNTMNN
eukprot:7667822-Pyramimonas_sp.AAC.1